MLESPPEQVRIARPPSPRGRARGSARTRASSSSSWESRAQAPPASSIRARKTRWSPATRPGVGRRGARAGLRGARLQHRDADAALGAARQRLGEPLAVAVLLQEHRDRAHSVALAEGGEPVARVERRLVAGGEDRVVPDPPSGAERVDGDVPALRDHRHAARARAEQPSRPTSAPASRTATMPLPFGPQTGQPAAPSAASRSSPLELDALRDLAEARPRARPRRRSRAAAASAITLGHRGRRDRDDHGVHRALAGRRPLGDAGTAVHLARGAG